MYKPPSKSGNRLRLDVQSQVPALHMFELCLQESKGRRGCLIELPFRGKKMGSVFTLTCQWDENQDLPTWALYEQVGEESKMHWSKPFPLADMQLIYDMASMSSMDSAPSAKIPDNLKAANASHHNMAPAQQPPAGAGYPMDYSQMQAPPPGYPGYPGYYPPPPPPMGYPQPYAPMMPGYPAMPGYPMPPDPYYGAQPPAPAPAPAPAQPAPAPAAPEPQPEPAKTSITPLMSTSGVFKRVDMSLISKGRTLDLGTLLLDARLVKQTSLEAAIKIQMMVEDGKIDAEIAPLALERFHTEGSKIDLCLTGDVLEKMREKSKEPRQSPSQAKPPEPSKPAAVSGAPQQQKAATPPPAAKGSQKSPEEVQKIRQAFDMLKKAGIINDQDIETAQNVLRKVGGDIVQILISANKFDKHTYEATHIVRPLIDAGLMKPEQAIIALNYCCRSRVDFDTALEEMDWPNPRKIRKDLNL